MKPMHMQDPWVFIRKTLENAFEQNDEETVRRMSRLIDAAMIPASGQTENEVYPRFAHHADCAENA